MTQRAYSFRFNYFYPVALIVLIVCLETTLCLGQISEDKKTYTVQPGETITDIAKKLGSPDFWKDLYEANADIIEANITPGQVLSLPTSIRSSPKFVYHNNQEKKTKLQKFREAFKQLAEKEKAEDDQAKDPNLDLGGFVLDETRSKMGRDFYNLFYQYWQAPENSANFTITISERPTFGRGTQVTVKINYEDIYKVRLQPRYEYIQAVSKQAVARAQHAVSQQASVREQLMGY